MPLETFIAESAVDAVTQIRHKLGPAAVVVNVRQLPGRLWRKPQIEVQAQLPEPAEVAPPVEVAEPVVERRGVGAYLRDVGLLPLHVERVLQEMGSAPAATFTEELRRARGTLQRLWPTRRAPVATGPHLLVGAPGVGKTTVLCKWLTQAVLLDGAAARVWRLDGRTANTAELLSVHGDVLGVPVERAWREEPVAESLTWIDLPGTTAAAELAEWRSRWPDAQVHVVLNAAYETSLLLAQVRQFAALPVQDLIVTHLDEEPRWGKLWNLALGTSYPLRFLSAGKNIPGEFWDATPERLLERNFPLK